MIEKFFKEAYGMDTIYNKNGFITYKKIDDETVWVEMLWIKPGKRKSHKGSDLADMVRELTGCNSMICEVDKGMKINYADTVVSFLRYGFEPIENNNKIIRMLKEF
jgi:hypothetical protein